MLGQDSSQITVKKFDKEPLLHEIKDGVDLKHVNTEDKSKPVIDEGLTIKNIGEQRENLLHDVEGFKTTSLNTAATEDRSAPQIPTDGDYSHVQPAPSLYSQAVDFVAGTYEQVKNINLANTVEAVKNLPAGTVEVVKNLPANTVEAVKNLPANTVEAVKNLPSGTVEAVKNINILPAGTVDAVKNINIIPAGTVEAVKQASSTAQDTFSQVAEFVADKLEETRKTVVHDSIETYEQSTKFVVDKWQEAKEAVGFGGTHPQADIQHDKPFLNDIAQGNIETLQHVETEDKSKPVIETGVNLTNVDKTEEMKTEPNPTENLKTAVTGSK